MKRVLLGLLACLACTSLTSCYRSRCEFWEDTKTCARYMRKGMGSLLGQHVDSREYATFYEKWGDGTNGEQRGEAEFVALSGTEQMPHLTLQEYAASRESPGDPGSKVPGIEKFVVPHGELAALFNHVRFETDSYAVDNADNVATLRKIAAYLTAHPDTYVFVEGHADERGAAAYNLALGSRRANSVRAFLIENGVNPNQLFTISYGLERPIVQGHDEGSWKLNRRSQFKLYER